MVARSQPLTEPASTRGAETPGRGPRRAHRSTRRGAPVPKRSTPRAIPDGRGPTLRTTPARQDRNAARARSRASCACSDRRVVRRGCAPSRPFRRRQTRTARRSSVLRKRRSTRPRWCDMRGRCEAHAQSVAGCQRSLTSREAPRRRAADPAPPCPRRTRPATLRPGPGSGRPSHAPVRAGRRPRR